MTGNKKPHTHEPDERALGGYLLICVTLGSGIGAAIGVGIGAAFGNVGMGIVFGIAMGSGLGTVCGILIAQSNTQHKRRRECPNCGYPTRGLRSRVCPECGAELVDGIG